MAAYRPSLRSDYPTYEQRQARKRDRALARRHERLLSVMDAFASRALLYGMSGIATEMMMPAATSPGGMGIGLAAAAVVDGTVQTVRGVRAAVAFVRAGEINAGMRVGVLAMALSGDASKAVLRPMRGPAFISR